MRVGIKSLKRRAHLAETDEHSAAGQWHNNSVSYGNDFYWVHFFEDYGGDY